MSKLDELETRWTDALDICGKGPDVVIARSLLQESINEITKLRKLEAQLADAIRAMRSEYICACGIRVTPHKCIADNGF